MNVKRVWGKCDDAQFLSDDIEAAIKDLTHDLVQNYHLMDRRMKWKADVLQERFSEEPISPFDFFTLNRSAFLPTLASAVTYFIIIIQFKLSEKTSVDDNSSTNSTILTNSTF